MGYISQEDLVHEMTAEQKILVQQFYAKFDIGGGLANKKIVNVEPLYYEGLIAGSEFLTYAATKMYIDLFLGAYITNGSATINSGLLLYDEANANTIQIDNKSLTYNTTSTALNYFNNSFETSNHIFSRISPSAAIVGLTFIGYRITLGTV